MTLHAIVVGAGPAGSIAALILARAGVEVDLLDRATFPRPKLCGDTVNPGTLAMLDALGVGAAVRSGSRPITGMLVTGPNGAAIAADYPDNVYGAAIERRHFDSALLAAAVAAGARLTTGVRVDAPVIDRQNGRVVGVRVHDRGRHDDLRGDVVLAADGRGSRLGAALGLTRFAATPQRWAFGAYYTGVAGTTTRGEMHIRTDGYVGIAPLTPELANVCVVRTLARTDRAAGSRAEETIEAAIREDVTLRERFSAARRVTPPVILGPLAVEAASAGQAGLLLAGDAAGFVDPMTGDGLRFAIRGGVLAAESALKELTTGQPAWRALLRARRREFSGKWRLNRTLRWLVGSPAALDVAATFGSRWPAAIRTLVAAAGDVHLARRFA
jgi:geranylgeranyl reductase family protein